MSKTTATLPSERHGHSGNPTLPITEWYDILVNGRPVETVCSTSNENARTTYLYENITTLHPRDEVRAVKRMHDDTQRLGIGPDPSNRRETMRSGKQTDRDIWDAIEVLCAETAYQARQRVPMISGNGCDEMDAMTTESIRAERARVASAEMSQTIARMLRGEIGVHAHA